MDSAIRSCISRICCRVAMSAVSKRAISSGISDSSIRPIGGSSSSGRCTKTVPRAMPGETPTPWKRCSCPVVGSWLMRMSPCRR